MSSPIPVAAPIDVSNPSTQAFGFALPCNNEVVFDAGYVRGGAGTQGGNIYGTWPEVLQTLGTLLVGASASTQLIKVQVDASLPAMPTFALSYPRIVGANTPTSVHPPYATLDLGSTSFTFTGELASRGLRHYSQRGGADQRDRDHLPHDPSLRPGRGRSRLRQRHERRARRPQGDELDRLPE